MSTRIYQGGGADRRFQSSAQSRAFTPARVASREKQIKQQGQQILDNLATADRERQRADEMYNVEVAAANKVETTNLQMAQEQAQEELRLSQAVDRFAVEATQLYEGNKLKMGQALERAQFENTQLLDQQTLKREQLSEELALERKSADEQFVLDQEYRAMSAQHSVDRAYLSAKQSVQRANTQLLQTGVNSLLNFGMAVSEYAIEQNQEEEKKNQALLESSYLFTDGSSVVLGDGSINPVIPAERTQRAVDAATETSVQSVAPGDPIQQENIRAETADGTAIRNGNQAATAQAGYNIESTYLTALYDPNTRVTLIDGRTVGINDLRTPAEVIEYNQMVMGAAVAAHGIGGMDRYTWVTTTGRRLRGTLEANKAALLRQSTERNQTTRIEMANAAADEVLAADGSVQEAWEIRSSGYWSSGAYSTRKEANDAAFQTTLAMASDAQLEQLAEVHKVRNPDGTLAAGTKFGTDKVYSGMIQSEIDKRQDAQWDERTRTSRANTIEIENINSTYTSALADAESDEQAQEITSRAIEAYEAVGTPSAIKEANALRQRGLSYNPSNFEAHRQALAAGEFIDQESLDDDLRSGRISIQEYNSLTKIGGTNIRTSTSTWADYEEAVGKDTIKGVERQLEGLAVNHLNQNGAYGLDQTVVKEASRLAVDSMMDEFHSDLRVSLSAFESAEGRKATRAETREMAQKWIQNNASRFIDPMSWEKGKGIVGFDYTPTKPVAAPGTALVVTNPNTNTPAFEVSQQSYEALAAEADSLHLGRDYILTQDELAVGIEGLRTGIYSPEINGKAKALGVTPRMLVVEQMKANGHPAPDLTPSDVGISEPTDMKTGATYLKRAMGFPDRGAAYLSGNIMQESSWQGQRDWGQVLNDGTSRNGGLISWASWADDPARLGKIENYLGKDIKQASHAEQLEAMRWELKNFYPNQYRIFMNPKATTRQLRRASKAYWGYGHEGNRFLYAEQLLNRG